MIATSTTARCLTSTSLGRSARLVGSAEPRDGSPHVTNAARNSQQENARGGAVVLGQSVRREVPHSHQERLRRRDGPRREARRRGPRRRQGNRRGDGRRLRRRGHGRHHRRHRRQEDRQAEQVRHRLPAAQPAQLLEDPAAQPRRVAGEGRGPRGRSDDRPLRQREEDADRHLQQRLPEAGRLRGGRRAVRLHQARPGQHADRRGRDDRPGGDHADHRREDPAATA